MQTERDKAKEEAETAKVNRIQARKVQAHMKAIAKEERRLQLLQVKLAKKEVEMARALEKEHSKESKKASQQLQETLQASVKKQTRRRRQSIHLPAPSLQLEVVSTAEPAILANPSRSRVRRLPAYLADFELDV